MAIFITKDNSSDCYDFKMRDSNGCSYILKISDVEISLDSNAAEAIVTDGIGNTRNIYRYDYVTDLHIQARVRRET